MQSPTLSLEMPVWGRHSGDGDGGGGALAGLSGGDSACSAHRRRKTGARARASGVERSRRAEARPEAFEVFGSCSSVEVFESEGSI